MIFPISQPYNHWFYYWRCIYIYIYIYISYNKWLITRLETIICVELLFLDEGGDFINFDWYRIQCLIWLKYRNSTNYLMNLKYASSFEESWGSNVSYIMIYYIISCLCLALRTGNGKSNSITFNYETYIIYQLVTMIIWRNKIKYYAH